MQLKMCKAAEYMDCLEVEYALQQPDRYTVIEQSVKKQNTVIKQHLLSIIMISKA